MRIRIYHGFRLAHQFDSARVHHLRSRRGVLASYKHRKSFCAIRSGCSFLHSPLPF